ncbi:hypothetical protein Ancab_016915, partial [Ancistrocladus abbreviatus]
IWAREGSCEQVIKEAWTTATGCFHGKIESCAKALAIWNWSFIGHVQNEIKRCERELTALSRAHPNEANRRKQIQGVERLQELLAKEEA